MAALIRGATGRLTNLALLGALLLALATGVGALAAGSPHGRWVVILHGVAAMAVILLVPAKIRVIRHGLARARPSRWASLAPATLAVTTVLTGLGHSTGLLRSVGGVFAMWLHIATAVALVPLAVWHIGARSARPRRSDLSRRTLLRAGTLVTAATAGYVLVEAAVRATGLAGARRRFTGSHEVGSFTPAAMPPTIWLDDRVPAIDPNRWRLSVVTHTDAYELTLADLAAHETTLRATLDCTSGWYAHQDWTGVPLSALLPDAGDARGLLVHSATGYWVRLPVRDLDRLLLATRVGGAALSAGHGYPLRLVAPGRRGFWWVKWVDRIELQRTPWWWQSPFPLT